MKNGTIQLDYTNILPFIPKQEITDAVDLAKDAAAALENGTGAGNDFLGWLRLPETVTDDMLTRLTEHAQKLRSAVDAFLFIGIGGSYLGARAGFDALLPSFHNETAAANGQPRLYFAGNHLSEEYHTTLRELLRDKKICINVISKSGTTTEPAVAFRILKTLITADRTQDMIVATTDAQKGALKKVADKAGMQQYIIPDDVGGRYSVLTPVGLFPFACAGIDINALITGARAMRAKILDRPVMENPALLYALIRYLLYRDKKKSIEIMAVFEPRLAMINEWWKQLFGESEGKNGNGIFPASVSLTTDLHSMGQYIQEGKRLLFETFLITTVPTQPLEVPPDDNDTDGLNYIHGKRLCDINRAAYTATAAAHCTGNVPNMTICIPTLDAYYLGALLYMFEYACGVSAYMLGVNPFNQQGVEEYKNNMFGILEKPGYEELTKKFSGSEHTDDSNRTP